MPASLPCCANARSRRLARIYSGCVFDFANNERELADLEIQSGIEGFWNDANHAQQVMRRIGELRSRIERWQDCDRSLDDLAELISLAEDDDLEAEFQAEADRICAILDDLELAAAVSGPHDQSNAILV